MKYLVILTNMKHKCREAILTSYDYTPGEIVYPFSKRNKYPGFNENRHKVIRSIEWDPNKRLYDLAVKYGALAE